ncbi:hypothetical protein B0H17DRAFT_1190156 [Mycena rosella]|uniref:Uncharacterized protein n=1 Tax=Mycena rosella TaxID=1033263 RepID=A0AAD7H2F2_MYCRO|nr:hypothetical protein B0H17DRAFT_1190156 [Mycena rosella]
MHIPFSVLVFLTLALPMLAAPLPPDIETRALVAPAAANQTVAGSILGDELSFERRAAKKAVKAKAAPKPKAKPVATKPKAKPLAKPKVTKAAAKPPAKKVTAPKPAPTKAKAPAKPPAKKVAAPKKTTAKAPAKTVPAKAPTTTKAAAKKITATPAAKPSTTKAAAKKVTATPAKKVTAKPPVKTTAKKAAVKPTAKPAVKPPAKPAAKKVTAAKPPAKSAIKTAPAKTTASTGTKATASAKASNSACPLTAKKGSIRARAGVQHPSGTSRITLFHAATSANAASVAAQGVDLSQTAASGDFSHRPEVAGGFYMTDSLIAAAQFACFESQQARTTAVDVLEFTWAGSANVKAFPSANAEFESFLDYNEEEEDVEATSNPFHAQALTIFKNDMVTGPLGGGVFDQDLTKNFLQYAVIQQAAASSKLSLVARHQNILCKNVPKKEALTATLYTQTQGGNSQFNTVLATLQDPNACA